MQFNTNNQSRSKPESMIALINIIFLLLIFFMVAGTLTATSGLEVNPPDAAVEVLSPVDVAQLQLAQDGRFALDGLQLAKEDLIRQLESRRKLNPTLTLWVKADAALPADQLLMMLSELRELGFTSISLVADSSS